MKKFMVVLVAVAGLVLAAGLPAVGQSESPRPIEERVRTAFSQARGQLIRRRCSALGVKVEAIYQAANARRSHWQGLQEAILQKLTDFTTQAQTAGLDVTQISADTSELSLLADDLNTAWQDYLDALQAITKDVDCQSDDLDPESIHAAIEDARDARVVVINGLRQFKQFLVDDIGADLADLRQQLSAASQGGN